MTPAETGRREGRADGRGRVPGAWGGSSSGGEVLGRVQEKSTGKLGGSWLRRCPTGGKVIVHIYSGDLQNTSVPAH